jgi:hypothetical protein
MSTNLANWIRTNTHGSHTVVEFGAMFFEQLAYVNETVGKKIGIEIHQPYIDKSKCHNCIKIQGDMRRFEELIAPEDMDCALFIDTLEHLTKDDAKDLMKRVMGKFKKVMLMIPEGNHPQTTDLFQMGGDEYQTHRSSWRLQELVDMGFKSIVLDPMFHGNTGGGKDTGCLFAVWEKN